MIQRIQTVYLSISALCAAIPVMLSAVLVSLSSGDSVYQLRPLGIYLVNEGVPALVLNAYPLAAASVLIIILSLYAIFQFSNRKFQIILARVGQLAHLLQVGLVMLYMGKMEELAGATEVQGSPSLWLLLPCIGLITSFLAVRAIQKDDELVRSADRLR